MIGRMQLSTEISYPGATPDDAFALVVDPKFRAAVCEATLALAYDVGIDETDGGGASVRVDRTVPAQVPDFVKKLVGETLDVRQTEDWSAPDADGSRTADIRVEIVGQPAGMTGTIVLETTADGCREVVSGQVKVSIPFLGGKIEPEVAKAIVTAMRVEQKTGREWLAKS
jgi:Protein of unknown function (DUF2505)